MKNQSKRWAMNKHHARAAWLTTNICFTIPKKIVHCDTKPRHACTSMSLYKLILRKLARNTCIINNWAMTIFLHNPVTWLRHSRASSTHTWLGQGQREKLTFVRYDQVLYARFNICSHTPLRLCLFYSWPTTARSYTMARVGSWRTSVEHARVFFW
jgi:hypothetical protein